MKRSLQCNLLVYTTIFLFLISCALIMVYSVAIAEDGVFIVNGEYTDAYWFAKSCHHATKCSVTVYSDDELTQPVTTIPAQTFIKTLSEVKWIVEGERCANHVEYMTYPGGSRGKGWIEDGSAVSNLASAYTSGGTHLLDLKLNNKKVINQYNYSSDPYVDNDPQWGDLSDLKEGTTNSPVQSSSNSGEVGKASVTQYNAKMEYAAYNAGLAPEPARKSDAASSKSSPDADNTNAEIASVTDQNDISVGVLELGLVYSKISYSGQTMEVATTDLVFGENIPEGKELAVIYAPNTGKASLRKTASNNATVIKTCKAGVIVPVIEVGKTYTKVNYKGTIGYVKNSSLQFYSATSQDTTTGKLSYKGKTNGGTTVNVRCKADEKSAVVATWKTGTAVRILSIAKGWYEIEAKGIHGWVLQEYLTKD